jgi:hypothetical protein
METDTGPPPEVRVTSLLFALSRPVLLWGFCSPTTHCLSTPSVR